MNPPSSLLSGSWDYSVALPDCPVWSIAGLTIYSKPSCSRDGTTKQHVRHVTEYSYQQVMVSPTLWFDVFWTRIGTALEDRFFCWEQRWCEESKFIKIMPSEKDEKEVELVQYQLVILCISFLLRMESHGTSTTVSCMGQPKLDMSVMSWQGSHFLKFYYCSEPDLGATKLQGDILWYWMILVPCELHGLETFHFWWITVHPHG